MISNKQFALQQKHKLSVDMFLAVCYIAQDHEYRCIINGGTTKALRRRRLINKEEELTSFGWSCYLELTDAGPCGTSGLPGFTPRNPRLLHEQAKPKLNLISKDKKVRKRRLPFLGCGESNARSPKLLSELMGKEELDTLRVEQMSIEQQAVLLNWMLRRARESSVNLFEIESIKYGGRLIVLDDGSRWEVGEDDTYISEMWCETDRVVIVDGEMFKLDERESATVAEEAA